MASVLAAARLGLSRGAREEIANLTQLVDGFGKRVRFGRLATPLSDRLVALKSSGNETDQIALEGVYWPCFETVDGRVRMPLFPRLVALISTSVFFIGFAKDVVISFSLPDICKQILRKGQSDVTTLSSYASLKKLLLD